MELTSEERARWREFKRRNRPDADRSKKEKIVIEMSQSRASISEIQEKLGNSDKIYEIRSKARRQGVF